MNFQWGLPDAKYIFLSCLGRNSKLEGGRGRPHQRWILWIFNNQPVWFRQNDVTSVIPWVLRNLMWLYVLTFKKPILSLRLKYCKGRGRTESSAAAAKGAVSRERWGACTQVLHTLMHSFFSLSQLFWSRLLYRASWAQRKKKENDRFT